MVDKRDTLKGLLPDGACTVAVANSTDFRALRGETFDLIIIEHPLDWFDESQLLQEIKVTWPLCRVIMLVSSQDEHFALTCMDAGLDYYCVDPQTLPKRLGASIKAALRDPKQQAKPPIADISDPSASDANAGLREVLSDLLQMADSSQDLTSFVGSLISYLKSWIGCDAVGIRLRQGIDYPYYETIGHSDEFVVSENSLCEYDTGGSLNLQDNGKPTLACLCGNVISGLFNSSNPCFTKRGTFWTNEAAELAETIASDNQCIEFFRGRCLQEFQSLALVRLNVAGECLGLLQLADKRPGLFTQDTIDLLEEIGLIVANAVYKKLIEEELLLTKRTVDQASEAIFWIDPDGQLIYVNNAVVSRMGFSREELLTMNVADISPRVREVGWNYVWGKVKQYGSSTTETYHRRKDGTEIPVEVVAIYMKSEGREFSYAFARDITERQKAENQLKETTWELQTVVDASPLPVVVLAPDLTVKRWNPAAERIFGWIAEEVFGKPYPAVPISWQETFLDYCKSLLTGPPLISLPVMGITKDGRLIDLSVSASALHSSDGKTSGIMAVIEDITERKAAEAALLASEAKHRHLYDSLQDAFASVDMSGKITDSNEAFKKMLGYSSEELEHLGVMDITPEEWQPIEAKIISEQVLAVGYSNVYEKEYRRKDGTTFPAELRTFLIEDECGKACGMWAIVRDISERRQAEQLLKASNERLQALSRQLVIAQETERRSIARELHDEIGATMTALSIVLQVMTHQSGEQAANRLQEAKNMVSEIMSRIQHMSINLRSPMLDDVGLIPALIHYFNDYQAKTGIRVSFDHNKQDKRLRSNLETCIYRVSQEALTNIARHAVVYEARVVLDCDEHTARLEVSDNGLGFDARRMTRNPTSLGLIGMRERVSALNGIFDLKSAPGKGTSITIALPIRDGENNDDQDCHC